MRGCPPRVRRAPAVPDVDPDQRPGRRGRQLGLAPDRVAGGPCPRRSTTASDVRCSRANVVYAVSLGAAWEGSQSPSPNMRMFGRARAPHRGRVGSGGRARVRGRRRRPSRPRTTPAPRSQPSLEPVDGAVHLGDDVGVEPSGLELAVDVGHERAGRPLACPAAEHGEAGVRHRAVGRARAGARRSPRPTPGRRRSGRGRPAPRTAGPAPGVGRVGPARNPPPRGSPAGRSRRPCPLPAQMSSASADRTRSAAARSNRSLRRRPSAARPRTPAATTPTPRAGPARPSARSWRGRSARPGRTPRCPSA